VTGIRRIAAPAVLLALALLATSLLGAAAAHSKKKHRGSRVVNITQPVNAAIPDRGSQVPGVDGLLVSQIVVGKKFKGKSIGDVNVTVQTTGGGPDAASDVLPYMSSPNGNTIGLFSGLGGQSIGPLTLDDEAGRGICTFDPPPCRFDPFDTLLAPYAGTAEPSTPLSRFDRGPVRGVWTLWAKDQGNGGLSTLVSWTLNVTPARPVK
jgi:hypothetical protein